jgi:hypothetical protein
MNPENDDAGERHPPWGQELRAVQESLKDAQLAFGELCAWIRSNVVANDVVPPTIPQDLSTVLERLHSLLNTAGDSTAMAMNRYFADRLNVCSRVTQ